MRNSNFVQIVFFAKSLECNPPKLQATNELAKTTCHSHVHCSCSCPGLCSNLQDQIHADECAFLVAFFFIGHNAYESNTKLQRKIFATLSIEYYEFNAKTCLNTHSNCDQQFFSAVVVVDAYKMVMILNCFQKVLRFNEPKPIEIT